MDCVVKEVLGFRSRRLVLGLFGEGDLNRV